MADRGSIDTLLSQRKVLEGRIEQEREQLEGLRGIVASLDERVAHDERMLHEIDSVLGKEPQLRLENANLRLRGKRLEEIALEVLADERGSGAEVHYRDWFELLRSRGHLVAGKEPVNTFLAQINRSDGVVPIGGRTGRYKLAA